MEALCLTQALDLEIPGRKACAREGMASCKGSCPWRSKEARVWNTRAGEISPEIKVPRLVESSGGMRVACLLQCVSSLNTSRRSYLPVLHDL